MKSIVVLIGLVALSSAVPLPQSSIEISREFVDSFRSEIEAVKGRGEISAVLNEYADKIFANIKNLIIHNGLDPAEMPDIHEGFNFTLLFITYHGELDMTRGWLNDVSTIHRNGDVVVTYTDAKRMSVRVPIGFDTLSFTYDYSAKLMNLGPEGGVEGKVSDLSVEVTIGFDFEAFLASLDEFSIMNSGKLDLNFTGNILIDWIIDLLVDVAATVLHPIILAIIQMIVRDPIQSVVDVINSILSGILNPATTSATILANIS